MGESTGLVRAGLRALLFAIGATGLLGFVAGANAGPVAAPAKGESSVADVVRERGELRAGIAIAPPWLGQDPKSGDYFGPAKEIGERVAHSLGVELTLVPSGWDVIIAGLQGNQFELAIAPLFATEKRRKVVDFVNYTQAGTCYAVLKSNDKLNSLEDLNHASVTIGTWTGTGTEHGIVGKYTNAKINSIVQQVSGANRVEDVITKRIDAAPFDAPRAFVLAKQYAEIKILPGGPEHCVNNADIPFPIGMAFNYGDPKFKAFLQAVVDDMQGDIEASIVKHSAPEFMTTQ